MIASQEQPSDKTVYIWSRSRSLARSTLPVRMPAKKRQLSIEWNQHQFVLKNHAMSSRRSLRTSDEWTVVETILDGRSQSRAPQPSVNQ